MRQRVPGWSLDWSGGTGNDAGDLAGPGRQSVALDYSADTRGRHALTSLTLLAPTGREESEVFGYHGRYLRIDLTAGAARWVPLPQDVLRRFLGGVGLGTWLLHRESSPGVDPFDPASALVFCFSPLVGTPLTTSAKFAVVCKSPLTFRLNDALSSSHFALAGKRTGADALVLTGACDAPSVLVVEDGEMRLEPAGDLGGRAAEAATERLAERFGPDHAAAAIGPAGEHLVRYATVSHGNRHAGRGGTGAVLGAKRLKAVVVAGSQRTALADPAGTAAAARDLSRRSFGPATA